MLCILAAAFSAAPASAQGNRPPLVLNGVTAGGLRGSTTERWVMFGASVSNRSGGERIDRVVVYFETRPDVQYSRDVWVPPHATLSSWMLVGPANAPPPPGLPASTASVAGFAAAPMGQGPLLAASAVFLEGTANSADLRWLLYDRTDGTDRPVLLEGDERIPSKPAYYRSPEPTTAILLDDEPLREPAFGDLPRAESRNDEAVDLARMFRQAAHLSDHIDRLPPGILGPTEQSFDGIDHLIVASDDLTGDVAGMRAARRWLEQGGRAWVMLDRVDPDKVAELLGDGLDFQVVDRVELTSFRIDEAAGDAFHPPLQVDEEQPVTFARVLLPAGERVKHSVNGWPVWFTRQVGRGKVVFTALGPRGWYQPKQPGAAREPTEALEEAAQELQPPPRTGAFSIDDFRPMLIADIGYSAVGFWTVALVFGGFLLAALALGAVLWKSRRREWLGFIGPAAAFGAVGVFVALGEASRRSAPPTTATAQLVDADPGTGEAAVHGLMAVYWPNDGAVEAASEQGGFYEFAETGAKGQTRRFVQTDIDSWHWDEPWLSRDPRFAPFHAVIATETPITAVAHFGTDGLEGKLSSGPFHDAADAVLTPPNGRSLAVHLNPDGTFRVGGGDVLPAEQYLAGAVLTDRRQRRQEVYRKYLKPPSTGRPDGPDVLLAWAEPTDLHLTPIPNARIVGDALLAIPLRLDRPAAGSDVTIPGPLLPYRQIINNVSARPPKEGNSDADMHLRFQLPASVLPLRVEQARLTAKINAPSRRVVIAGAADAAPVVVGSWDNPLDPIRVDIADEHLLRLDEDGGLHLNVSLKSANRDQDQNLFAAPGSDKWSIEYLEVEIRGTMGNAK